MKAWKKKYNEWKNAQNWEECEDRNAIDQKIVDKLESFLDDLENKVDILRVELGRGWNLESATNLILYCKYNWSMITGCDNCEKRKKCSEMKLSPRSAMGLCRHEYSAYSDTKSAEMLMERNNG